MFREEGEIGSKGREEGEIGSESREKGVLPPCSSPLTVEPRFNKVAGDRPNLFVKWRVRCIENLDITNLRGNDQNVCYIEVIAKD